MNGDEIVPTNRNGSGPAGLLPSRRLARSGALVPPVIWDVREGSRGAAIPFDRLKEAGAVWFCTRLPEGESGRAALDVCAAAREGIGPEIRFVLGVTPEQLRARRNPAVGALMASLRIERFAAVVLTEATPGEIKAGSPFHRLSRWREAGVFESVFVDAPDYETAEWMLHHSPAHAVCLPYGVMDQRARYRLFEDARGFGVSLVAKRVTEAVWGGDLPVTAAENVSFVAGEPAVASQLIDLGEAEGVLSALEGAMSSEERERWWERFRGAVPPPPEPTRNLPPEFGG